MFVMKQNLVELEYQKHYAGVEIVATFLRTSGCISACENEEVRPNRVINFFVVRPLKK